MTVAPTAQITGLIVVPRPLLIGTYDRLCPLKNTLWSGGFVRAVSADGRQDGS